MKEIKMDRHLPKSLIICLLVFLAIAIGGRVTLAEDATEYTRLTVNFLRQNSTEPVGTPYTGQFQAGTEYPDETIAIQRFPTYAGYMPSLPVVPTATGLVFDFQASDYKFTYSFDGTQVAGDITIDIVFVPILNVYKAEYYHQSIEDSTQYEKVATETFSGVTGQPVDVESIAERHTADGFAMREFNAPTVAADGSTVVRVYYDRAYYLLSFEPNGAVESASAQYLPFGATIGTVATPTRPGYTFTGWSPAIPSTMPAQNTTCTAQWNLTSPNANVSIVVWGENANDDNYAYLSSSVVSAPVGSMYTAYICNKIMHEHSSACGISCKHSHDVRCYGATSTSTNKPDNSYITNFTNIENSLVDKSIYMRSVKGRITGNVTNTYWLYYNGSWYSSNSNSVLSERGKSSTTVEDFVYDVTYYVYTAKSVSDLCIHPVHDDECYLCGLEEHVHTNNCCAFDMSLYNINTELTETQVAVDADGSAVLNVYYDRKTFTITMNYDYRNKTYNATEYITAKWGQNIASQWNEITARAGNSKWTQNPDDWFPTYQSLIVTMPSESRTYFMKSSGDNTYTGYYYTECMDQTATGSDIITYEGVKYKLLAAVPIKKNSNVTMTEEDKIDIDGFAYYAGYQTDWNGAQLKYKRKSYELVLNNGKENVGTESLKFEMPLSAVSALSTEPAHPDTIPSAYIFDGWSLSPDGGSEPLDLSAITMPASSLILYARWKVPEYNVLAYESDDESSSYFEGVTIYGGKIIGLTEPAMENHEFIGWFYTDGAGVEHAFDPETMYVVDDMKLHAKWRNLATAEYTVSFVEQGTSNALAEPQTGTATVDTSFTVTPKTISGYFPTQADSSITVTEAGPNAVTFEYVKVSNVPYMVTYKDEDGNTVATAKTVDTNALDVVTEKYVPVTDYVVKEAFITRYLTVESGEPQPEDNVIEFVYVPNATDIMVTVEYYINTDLTGESPTYTLHSYSQALKTFAAGSAVTVTPMDITNYTLNTAISSPTTQNMASTKQDMVFTFKYDPQVVTVTFRDGVTEGNDGILQSNRVLPGSRTPAYVSAAPTHPVNPDDYIFDDVNGFVDINGNAPATTATEDATYYAQWAGVFHVHHCTEAQPAKDDIVEKIRVDAIPENETFNITAPLDDIYGGITEGCMYGGLWSDSEATKLLSYDTDSVCGVRLSPTVGDHYYVREISNGYLTPKTLTVRIKGKYYCVIVTAVDDPANYIDMGFDTIDGSGNEKTVFADAYDALKVNYTNNSTTTYTAGDVFKGLSGKLLCCDLPPGDGVLTFKPFFATPDCVKVCGLKTRTLTYHENSDSSKSDVDDEIPCDIYGTLSETYADSNEVVRMSLTVSPALEIGEVKSKEAVITLNVDGLATYMTVPAGTDCRERITNPSVAGSVFVGWFRDAACTRPANLACVTGDMEIYAGFMSDSYLQVAELPAAAASGIRRLRLVSAVDMALTSSCGFIVSDDTGSHEIEVTVSYDSIDGFKAADLFEGTDEFASLICHDIAIPGQEDGRTIAVTPYWIPLTGAIVHGTTRRITVKDN